MSKKDVYFKKAIESRHWETRHNQSEPYYNLLKNISGDLKGRRLLDVGCAVGFDVKDFSDRGLMAEGIDINKEFIDEAQKKFPNLSFKVGDAEDLPYEDGIFDFVFSINTLFWTDLRKSLKEFIRVLKKNGLAIFNFDTQIINLDENNVFYSENLSNFKIIVQAIGANIAYLGDETKRLDLDPFKHEHTFRIVVLKNK